jgi:hypothetical protein
VALLDLESEMARARDGSAFSNGFEGEAWIQLWCTDCAVDTDLCPLLGTALLGRTPAAWTLREPGGLNRYTCTEYRETDTEHREPQ